MSTGTIAAIVAVIILVTVVPLGIILFLHKRGGAWSTFLIGAGTFLLFANAETIPTEISAMVETLLTTPSAAFLWSGFERLTAMALHMALSVMVFASVHTSQRWLYPAAILSHAAVDFVVVIANSCLPIAATELLLLAPTALLVLWAARIYKKLPQ